MLLEDKVVIVSGIGPGLGVKLAIEAAREGARVAVAARTPAKLDDAERRMREVRPDCEVLKVPTDIADRAQCRRLVDETLARFGRIDGLVNSAFLHGSFEPIERADLDGWREIFGTNVVGSLGLTLEVVPHMKRAGGGAIAMISTMATRKPFAGEAGYAASKGALGVASKYLAQELGAYNIRVNTVCLGWMWGAPVQGYVRAAAAAKNVAEAEIVAPIAANIALRRIPTDDECARAALFLVSDYASAVTGALLDVNGGEFFAV